MKKAIVVVAMGVMLALGMWGRGVAQMSHGGMAKNQGSQKGIMGMMGPMGLHKIFMKAVRVADTEKQKESLWALEKKTASQCAALMVEMMQHKDMMKDYMMKEGCNSPDTQKHFQLMLQARDKMAKARMKALADIEKIIGKEKMKEVLGQSGMMGMGSRN